MIDPIDRIVSILGSAMREAFAECEQCGGRVYGDCSSDCQYWPLTAVEADFQTPDLPQRRRNWSGPREPTGHGKKEIS